MFVLFLSAVLNVYKSNLELTQLTIFKSCINQTATVTAQFLLVMVKLGDL